MIRQVSRMVREKSLLSRAGFHHCPTTVTVVNHPPPSRESPSYKSRLRQAGRNVQEVRDHNRSSQTHRFTALRVIFLLAASCQLSHDSSLHVSQYQISPKSVFCNSSQWEFPFGTSSQCHVIGGCANEMTVTRKFLS